MKNHTQNHGKNRDQRAESARSAHGRDGSPSRPMDVRDFEARESLGRAAVGDRDGKFAHAEGVLRDDRRADGTECHPYRASSQIKFLPLVLLFVTVYGSFCPAASLLEEARQARAESIPEVAVQKLRAFLATPDLPDAQRPAGARELAAALLDAGHLDEALGVIRPVAAGGHLEAHLLQARILAAAGKWSEAEPLYRALSAQADAPAEVRMGLAESLRALGRMNEAVQVLESFAASHPKDAGVSLRLASLLLEIGNEKRARQILSTVTPASRGDEKWKDYLDARLLLAKGKAASALAIFDELRDDPRDVSEALLFGATLGSSAAQAALSGYDGADTVLEAFIRDNPESAYLDAAFRQLDVVYTQQIRPSDGELKRWVQKPPARRAALAEYYQARLQLRVKKLEKAAATFDQFVQNYPSHPLAAVANVQRADLLLARGDLAGALSALDAAMRGAENDAQRAEIELRTGLVYDRQGEALLAENSFRRAAKLPGRLRMDATFDAALEALRLKNYESFFADYHALSAAFPDAPLLSDLELEEGLAQARTGDARAADTLDLFLRRFPKHPRQGEARLALADLAFARGDTAGASGFLKVVNETGPSPATTEDAAYLAIFLADSQSPRSDEKVIDLAERFLREHAASQHAPEVRMKLGQVHFRNSHYPNAETEFTLLAQSNPNGPYAEPALFLAGRAAMKTLNTGSIDRALNLFDQVVKREGPLKLYARQQQASIKHSQLKEDETVTIYDNILSATPPPDPELRFASLCGKGDSLIILGRTDPSQMDAAIAVFDQLAAQPDVTPEWRNQALYKKGKALEQLSRRDEAITAYYDVLDKSGSDGREFFWYYKAGFDAAHLFEQQNQWKSAIGIYQKLARVEGPRAAEARKRVSEIRLQKFIWE